MEDFFSLKKDTVSNISQDLTKRACLALLAQLWDLIGLIAPVAITFRIDLQELWNSSYSWHAIPPESVQQRWKENVEAMNHVLTFEIRSQTQTTWCNGTTYTPQVHGLSGEG